MHNKGGYLMNKLMNKLLAMALVMGIVTIPLTADDNLEGTSTGKVTIEAPKKDPGVVDPTNPTEPVEPDEVTKPGENENGGPTGSDGPLRFDSLPWFDFGVLTAGENIEGRSAKAGDKWSESLQLSDLRFEKDAAWTLSVGLSNFTTTDTANSKTVSGAITFTNTGLYSEINKDLELNGDTTDNGFTIESGGAVQEIIKDANAPGKTILSWFSAQGADENPNVSLDFDATNELKDEIYIVEINWTLTGTLPTGD